MATLQQQRQAIAEGMAARRAATGGDERKALGKSLIEQRTGKAVAEDINRLAVTRGPRKTLRRIEPVGALPSSRGRGVYIPPPATGGGGIASPLTEITAAGGVPVRDYWPDGMTSSDGLFVLPAIKTLNLLDDNGEEVTIQLANPKGTAP